MSRGFYHLVFCAFAACENEGTLNVIGRACTRYIGDLSKSRQATTPKAWHILEKMNPFCSSSRTILPRRCVVTREHRGYSLEVLEHGKKASTRDSKAKDLSGRKRRQNRTVYVCQGRPAAQENGRRRNHDKEVVLVLTKLGG